MRRRALRRGTPLVVTVVLLVMDAVVGVPAAAPAAVAEGFEPGSIISEAAFRDASAMSAEEIDALLAERGSGCVPGPDGAPCLKDHLTTAPERPPLAACDALQPAVDESAGSIVARAAAACGVSPHVLLAILQQAHGLVTASGEGLSLASYADATGFSCGRHGRWADCADEGFAHQVYGAATALRAYADDPGAAGFPVGQEVLVPYHPDAACGGSEVLIADAATAALYGYFSYQPNPAALAAGSGTGDSCSSYGVRDVWRVLDGWFDGTQETAEPVPHDVAPPTSEPTPDDVPSAPGEEPSSAPPVDPSELDLGGDALAPDEDGPEEDTSEDDTSEGDLRMGGDPGDPIGELEVVVAEPGGSLRVTGWAMDPDSTGPIYVWVSVDGSGQHLLADRERVDVAEAHPGTGARHGFAASMPAPVGERRVCVTASNVGTGSHTVLGCDTVTVRAGSPFGNVERMASTPEGIQVSGWAIDPDTTASIYLWVTVDGVGRHVLADRTRSDVGRVYPVYGSRHGFSATIPATPGEHRVCITAANVAAGAHAPLGCRGMSEQVRGDRSPFGNFEAAVGGPDGIEIRGWAIDPDTVSPIYLWVTVDGRVGRHIAAGSDRLDVARAFPRFGGRHGFVETLAVAPGSHRVCVTASNVGPGSHTPLGCRDVRGSGGTLADTTFQVFTASDGVKGQYHVFAEDIDPRRSVGLMVQFHGDGAYEFTHPDSSYSLGGRSGLRAEAAKRNMVLLVAKTPDVTGSPTWWESGPDHADYAAELIQRVAYDRFDIDPERTWLVGYSGGAQFITKFLLPEHSSLFSGGGAVIFAGGGVPWVEVKPFSPDLVADFPMHWYTGALDDGTCLWHRYKALRDARAGSAWYADAGFLTSLETPEGVCHNLSGRFGPVTGERLDRHDGVAG